MIEADGGEHPAVPGPTCRSCGSRTVAAEYRDLFAGDEYSLTGSWSGAPLAGTAARHYGAVFAVANSVYERHMPAEPARAQDQEPECLRLLRNGWSLE